MNFRLIYSIVLISILFACKPNQEPKMLRETTVVDSNNNDVAKKHLVMDATKDAEFVMDSYSSGLYAIQAAELVKYQAKNKAIIDLADKVSDTHKKIVSDLGGLANAKKISLPSGLSLQQRSKIKELGKKDTESMEVDFVVQMENKNKEDIELLEKVSKESEDNEISTVAISSLSALRTQFEEVKAVKERMNL